MTRSARAVKPRPRALDNRAVGILKLLVIEVDTQGSNLDARSFNNLARSLSSKGTTKGPEESKISLVGGPTLHKWLIQLEKKKLVTVSSAAQKKIYEATSEARLLLKVVELTDSWIDERQKYLNTNEAGSRDTGWLNDFLTHLFPGISYAFYAFVMLPIFHDGITGLLTKKVTNITWEMRASIAKLKRLENGQQNVKELVELALRQYPALGELKDLRSDIMRALGIELLDAQGVQP